MSRAGHHDDRKATKARMLTVVGFPDWTPLLQPDVDLSRSPVFTLSRGVPVGAALSPGLRAMVQNPEPLEAREFVCLHGSAVTAPEAAATSGPEWQWSSEIPHARHA
ncbi:hypothetical protein ACOMHN_028586 [Nucella lapillus]